MALAFETARSAPERVTALSDPFIVNLAAQRSAYAAVDAASVLHSSTLFAQRKSASLEEAIVGQLQSSIRAFASSTQLPPDDSLLRTLGSLSAEAEWSHLASRPRALLDDDASPPATDEVSYEGMHDDLALPLRRGALERKRRISRASRSADYVLSPAGFLHEYAVGMEGSEEPPRQSWFLPACSVGPPPDPARKVRRLQIARGADDAGADIQHRRAAVHLGAGQDQGRAARQRRCFLRVYCCDVRPRESVGADRHRHPDAVAWHTAICEYTKTDRAFGLRLARLIAQ